MAAIDESESIERFGYTQELRRSLSFTDLLFYGLVFMVPIAPFGIFGGVFQASGGMVALAYVIGAVAMVFTAWSYAQMVRAFLALHVSVVVHYIGRRGSRDYLRHLVLPAIGFAILLFVVVNARIASQIVGLIWLAIGAIILIGLYATGHRPSLSGLAVEEDER